MTNSAKENTIGETLRQKRQELNLDIDSISKKLNIKSDVLKALEGENWHLINQNLYLTGLILSYAKMLMIDQLTINQKILALDIKSNVQNKKHQLLNIGRHQELTPDRNILHTSIFASSFFIIISLIFLNLNIGEKNIIDYPKLYQELKTD